MSGGRIVKLYTGWNTMVEKEQHPVTGNVTTKEAQRLLFEITKK